MHEDICKSKRELDLVTNIIDAKQMEKIVERFDLFKKKYEKVMKMVNPEEIEGTLKDITKYENKVRIYLNYLVINHKDDI